MLRKLVVSYGVVILAGLLALSVFIYLVVFSHLLNRQGEAQLLQAQVIATGLGRSSGAAQQATLLALSGQLNGRLLMLDGHGFVVYDSFADHGLVGRQLQDEATLAALAGDVLATHSTGGDDWSTQVAVPVWRARQVVGAVVYVQSITEVWTTLRQLALALLIGNLGVVTLTVLLSGIVAARITKPLKLLDNSVRALAQGEAHQPLTISGRDELATLTNNFNVMAVKLQTLEQQRRQFLADAAHELRTPLASLQALLEPLSEAQSLSPDQYKPYLKDALREVGRLHGLVEELLDVSRLQGTVHLQKARVDVSATLHSIVKLLTPMAQAKLVSLQLMPLAQPAVILADGEKLKQVFVNLLDNAIKYSPEQSHVVVSESLTEKEYVVEFADDGPGIEPADLPHLFERFYRGDKARHRDTGGSGLGLAIASRIIDLHHGRIEVDSQSGHGSRFTVIIPVA